MFPTAVNHRRLLNGLGFLACALLLAAAWYLEHFQGMNPCPLCMFQRVAVAAVGGVFLLAFLHGPRTTGARVYGALLVLVSGLGAALAIRHLWLQSLPEDQVPACGPGLDYMLDVLPFWTTIQQVLAGSGECAEVDRLFGVTLPAWTLLAFALLGLWALFVNLPRAARAA
jgi:disulfide bond formation protein DsbB